MPLSLFVIGMAGKNYTVTINTETVTVGQVKENLFNQLGLSPKGYELRLIAGGKLINGSDNEHFDAAVKKTGSSLEAINYKIHMTPPKNLRDDRVAFLSALHPRLGKDSPIYRVCSSSPSDIKAFATIFEMLDPNYRCSQPTKVLWDLLPVATKASISEQTHEIRSQMAGGRPTVSNYWNMLTAQEQQSWLLRVQQPSPNLVASEHLSATEEIKESSSRCSIS